jgi:S-DNA-T family DNA segregation ATPase FtsK/SpoIIIE
MKRKKDELLGIALVLGALYLAVALFSYSRWDTALFTYSTFPVRNFGGVVGSYISDFFFMLLGLAAFSIPAFMVFFGLRKLFFSEEKNLVQIIGTGLFIISLSLLMGLIGMDFVLTGANAGGFLGQEGAGFLEAYLSVTGGYMAVALLLFSSLILLSPVSIPQLILERWRKGKTPLKGREPEELISEEESEQEIDEGAEEEIYEDEPPVIIEPVENNFDETDAPPARSVARAGRRGGKEDGYVLPPLDLLNEPASQTERPGKDEVLQGSALLEKKLRDFGIQGKVIQVHAGPIVTMYEFEPAPGVKIQRVVSLAEDLSLALKAPSVRIAPVPGKSALGIEVPNRVRETVVLREMVGSEEFKKSSSLLTLALGKDIYGNAIVANLARMPHLLVAGATGAGKSVCLNSIIASVLYKASPKDVKFLMIDPKLLELSAYEGIPHLISPVITSPKAASEALKKMVFEMERRYRLIAEKGAKSIESFNRTAPEEELLPYIVVVIDELADLMLSSAAEVEDSIGRLAQMARASGIHLIVATQRPSVDVLTGVIKANFPTRISFQVASRIDSRTILDAQGAEQLIGKGDMLFVMPGTRIIRVHGAFISEAEIKGLADFVRSQANPDFNIFQSIEPAPAEDEEAKGPGGRDEFYEKAVDLAASMGEISISYIQRRLKIGFNRAARIMELMEEDGLVGPPQGAGKPRAFIGRRNF